MIRVRADQERSIRTVMVELDQFKYTLSQYEQPLKDLKASLDLENKKNRIDELDRAMEAPDFWTDAERSTKLSKEAKNLKDTVQSYNQIEQDYTDAKDMIDIANEEDDHSLIEEIQALVEDLTAKIDMMKTQQLLSGQYDHSNAILRLNAGAGGTESCDWCSMLYRMYTRWAEKKGFTVDTLDFLDGDEAGIKSVTIQINGENAYGFLRSEHGIHRLVRISPFNAQGKRQTSFVSCDIMPDIEEDLDVEIKDDDIRIDTYRSSGAGGQHINKTSSAIRITHFPTGIVVTCQNERSQFQNKDKAMQMLKTKLFMLKQQENMEKLSGIRGEVKDNGWGSQIRSYVLQPYKMVKDLRTGCESGNTDAVLDGGLDKFITAYLTWMSLGCPDRRVED